MEEVIALIENGQRRLALKTLIDGGRDLDDLFIELREQEMFKEISVIFSIAQSTGYISFNPANLRNIK